MLVIWCCLGLHSWAWKLVCLHNAFFLHQQFSAVLVSSLLCSSFFLLSVQSPGVYLFRFDYFGSRDGA